MGLNFQRKVGSALAVTRTAALPKSSPFRFTRPEDVPEDLAMTLAVNANQQFLTRLDFAGHLFSQLELDRDRARVPRGKEPSKNGPCPCGSGKKHKRCCGVEAG